MSSEKWFIQKLLEIDQKVNALSRGGVGIGKSSIAAGESLTASTETGEVVFKDGGLDYVSGEVPPVPSSPTLVQDFGQLRVTWDGTFAGEVVEGVEEPVLVDAPLDLDVIEVHASRDPEEANWGGDTMRSQIKTREGGTVPITGFDVEDEVFVVLIALSKAGLRSEPSAPTSIIIEGLNFDQLFNELDAATTIINNAREILIENEKTLGEKLDEVPDAAGISEDIATARQEAIDAALAELEALEGTLTTKIDGKTTTQWSTSDPPSSYTGAVGDTWIKLTSLGTGGREIARSKWNGSTWTVHKVDGASLSNVDASTITAGFLDVANRIRANSIFADKLLIGGGANLIPAPDFSTGWGSLLSVVPGEGKDGSNLVRISASTSTTGGYSGRTSGLDPLHSKVTGGSFYRVSAWVRSDIEIPPNSASLYVRAFTAQDGIDNTFSWADPTTLGNRDTIPANTWSLVSGIVEMPEGAIEASLGLYVRYTFNHAMEYCLPSIQSATDGTLITPGGVQTPHLAADVLEVSNLKAGTAAIAEAVVKKLFAEVVVAQMVTATEFIGENAILTGAVTAPKLTVTEEMWAKFGEFVKIRAGQIEADAIDSMTLTGTTLQSRDGNFRAGDDGVYIAQPDGTSLVRFPTDGSPLSMSAADVEIERANVDDLEILNGSVRSGGRLTIESGVVAPVSPPVGTSGWKEVANIADLDPDVEANITRTGFEKWGDKWVRSLNIHGNTSDDCIQIINADGTLDRQFTIDFNPRYGLTVMGNIAYVFGVAWTGGQAMIRGYDLNTGGRVKSWNYDRSITSKPTLGNDGTYLVIAGVYGYKLWVHKRSTSTGAQVGLDIVAEDSWPSGPAADLFGINFPSPQSTEFEVVPTVTSRVYKLTGSKWERKTDSANAHGFAGWNTPGSSPTGVYWAPVGDPFVVTVTGEIYESSTRNSDYTIEAGVTWYDGTRETTPGPMTVIKCGARSFPTLSVPVRPGLQKRVYWRINSGGQWRRETLGASATSVTLVPETSALTYPPPTSNTFPDTSPAELRTSNLNFQLSGNGSGKWGNLGVSASGDLSGIPKTATGGGVSFPTVDPNGGSQTIVVTFPSGRFTKAPSVSAMTSHGRVTPVVFNISKDSFSFRVWNFTSNSAYSAVGTWLAVEEA